jgi:CheY-like chemotaxis protein
MTGALKSGVQVLIVDDDDLTRNALQSIVEGEGYPAATAANGREAFNYLLRNVQPRLILLDLMMPVMSGWEFRYEQRRDPTLARIPVVVCSGAGDLEQEVSLLGAAGCLKKPIDAGRLVDTVRSFCNGIEACPDSSG